MPKFKVTFVSGDEEIVAASHYGDVKTWLVFFEDDQVGLPREILRVKATSVRRVDRVED